MIVVELVADLLVENINIGSLSSGEGYAGENFPSYDALLTLELDDLTSLLYSKLY